MIIDSKHQLTTSESIGPYNLSVATMEKLNDIIKPFFSKHADSPRFNVKLDDLTDDIDPTHPEYQNILQRLKKFKYLRGSLSANSQIALNSVMQSYVSFCRQIEVKAFPAQSVICLAYYIHLDSKGLAYNTISQHIAQISTMSKVMETKNPNLTDEISTFRKALEEQLSRAADKRLNPQQANPFRSHHLSAIIEAWHTKSRAIFKRDLAVLVMAYATSLREEEICQCRIEDVIFEDDGSIKIMRRSSKTLKRDLEPKFISPQLSPYIKRYYDELPAKNGDFFVCGVNPTNTNYLPANKPMGAKGFNAIFERAYLTLHPEMKKQRDELIKKFGRDKVKKRMYDPEKLIFQGHSARSGSVIDAYINRETLKLDLNDLMRMGDWTTPKMLFHYIRHLGKQDSGNYKNQSLVQIPQPIEDTF
ncbi:hypothetical protein ACP3V3_02630 [Vibrio sp. PNB22_3_1]